LPDGAALIAFPIEKPEIRIHLPPPTANVFPDCDRLRNYCRVVVRSRLSGDGRASFKSNRGLTKQDVIAIHGPPWRRD
jgi:hypothetical protein